MLLKHVILASSILFFSFIVLRYRRYATSDDKHITLINIAFSLSFVCTTETKKRGPCFILRWAILHLALCGNTQERCSQWTNAFHLAQSAFAGAGQQWPREYSGGPRRRPENGFRGACGSEAFCRHTFLQCCAFPLTRSPFLSRSPGEQNKQPGQSPDTFPSNFHCRMCSFSALMACHFSGAFGQELILESKQIFRGAIFHQVLIFLHSQSLYSLI